MNKKKDGLSNAVPSKASLTLEEKLQIIADVLELFLNWFVLLCVINCVGAYLEMLTPPLWHWFILLVYPIYYWILREKVKYLSLFLVLHLPVAIGMPYIAFQMTHDRTFWIIIMIASAVLYTFHSIYARIREKKADTVPYGMAVGISVPAFLLSAYLESDLACTRIMVLGVMYVFVWLIRSYLEYFSNYLKVNRSAAGAMPEKNILQTSLRNVLLSTTAITAFLVAVIWSPVAAWMTRFARDFGFLLLKGIGYILAFFSKTRSEGEEILKSDVGMGGGMTEIGGLEDAGPSLLAQILEKILFIAAIVFAVFLIVVAVKALARYLMEGFYEKRGGKREVEREGFLEEEEHLGRSQEQKQFRLPFMGGTPEEKVRRIFWKAVLAECEKRGTKRPDTARTARQLANAFSEDRPKEWAALAELYEKARYGKGDVTREECRQASALARQVRK